MLLESLKQRIDLLELQPSSGGCFEVFADGEEIYSKLATGVFPDNRSILRALEGRRS